jgi:hypothetical protein
MALAIEYPAIEARLILVWITWRDAVLLPVVKTTCSKWSNAASELDFTDCGPEQSHPDFGRIFRNLKLLILQSDLQ